MKGFALSRAWDGDQLILKFLVCDTQLNLSLVFQDCLVYGFLVKCKIFASLGYLLWDHVTPLLTFRPFLLIHYIDDIFFIWPYGEEKLTQFLSEHTNFHSNLKFTYETSSYIVNFLDLNVSLRNDAINTGLLLNQRMVTNTSIISLLTP